MNRPISNKKQITMPDSEMNGLYSFISDIRECKSREDEVKRINKELANIRSKFAGNKILKNIKKKKYVCKLVFIFLLGHNVDFGHIEAINLMNSGRYSEKYIGYLFASILLNEKSNLMPMVVKVLESDLMSSIPESRNLALKYMANMANRAIAEVLGDRVLSLLFNGNLMDDIKQSALLTLLALYKIDRSVLPDEKDYPKRLANFLSHQNMGVVTAAVCLVEELVKNEKIHMHSCIAVVIGRLKRLVTSQCLDICDYHFYFVVAPWQCVRLMRLLRYCSIPSDPVLKSCLVDCVDAILNNVQEPPKTKKMEHRLAKYSLLLEAVHLIHSMEMGTNHRFKACFVADACLKQREPNLRFLALECLEILCKCESTKQRVQQHQMHSLYGALNYETDECIREKAADILGMLYDETNHAEIISEMFLYLDTCAAEVKDKVVLKIYQLVEKYHADSSSYVDAVMDLVFVGKEYVKNEIWYRYVQYVMNHPSVRGYATKRAFEVANGQLMSSQWNENVVILAAYILGEFGNFIAGDDRSTPKIQLNLLDSNFSYSSWETRALLLTTYVKFANLFPEIKDDVKSIFTRYSNSSDVEVQQRAVEYLHLLDVATGDYLATVLEEMPPFKKQNPIIENALVKLKEKGVRSPPKPKLVNVPNPVDDVVTTPYNALFEEPKLDMPVRSVTLIPKKNNAVSNVDILAKAFCDAKVFDPIPIQRSLSTTFQSSKNDALIDQIWHKQGTLYDSAILRVRFSSHFSRQDGQIRFKYLNKTNCTFSSFLAHFPFEDNSNNRKWNFVVHPCPTTVSPECEVEQHIGVECLQPFTFMPSLSLSFVSTGSHQVVPIQVPMTLNKFVEPTTAMSFEEFKLQWNRDPFRQNHLTKTVPAKYILSEGMLEMKLNGFGLAILENVDLNTENFVCSGVFHSRSGPSGILCLLRPQYLNFTYTVSVRSMGKEVSEEVLRLLELII